MKLIDRLDYARRLASSRRVLDIGGARMEPGGMSPFDIAYKRIEAVASSYVIADASVTADIRVDLDEAHDVLELADVLKSPVDLILCMETLEHLRNPGHVCTLIQAAIECGKAREAFITIPRTSMAVRWLERHGLGRAWKPCDHLYAFHDHHAAAFMRHNFPRCRIRVYKCIGRYNPAWPLLYAATGFRGLSLGFHITIADWAKKGAKA